MRKYTRLFISVFLLIPNHVFCATKEEREENLKKLDLARGIKTALIAADNDYIIKFINETSSENLVYLIENQSLLNQFALFANSNELETLLEKIKNLQIDPWSYYYAQQYALTRNKKKIIEIFKKFDPDFYKNILYSLSQSKYFNSLKDEFLSALKTAIENNTNFNDIYFESTTLTDAILNNLDNQTDRLEFLRIIKYYPKYLEKLKKLDEDLTIIGAPKEVTNIVKEYMEIPAFEQWLENAS